MRDARQSNTAALLVLALSVLLAFGLRWLVWRWREFYPLGGDEQEYLRQALILLQERRYEELRLMRPPLYSLFLAGSVLLVDSLVQNLRLVQAIISALTVAPVWLLTREAARAYGIGWQRPAGVAALLAALSYTLAANATELLTETVFLFGLTLVFWLLLRAARLGSVPAAAFAGLIAGALCLVRSVALPLLPLGAVWLLVGRLRPANAATERKRDRRQTTFGALAFAIAALLVFAPWTARNYATYGGMILIDTTGAENLWLDNDPAGREAVKAQLYAMGDDRLGRQQLAMRQGTAVIAADPQRFAAKAWRELTNFFALEYADDMIERRAIWVPPAEVWLRLALGDGLWLALALAGAYGLAGVRRAQPAPALPLRQRLPALLSDPRWAFVPWALYVVLTGALFHVELRYRLPLYPVLLPFAALALGGGARTTPTGSIGGATLVMLILGLTLLHAPYPQYAWERGWKHWYLASAAQALAAGDPNSAAQAAHAARNHDPESALARVALARAALDAGDPDGAETWLREAIALLPAHPHAHLLLGDLLRQRGTDADARREFAYETGSLEDLQDWSWQRFTSPPPDALDVGGGLDLGHVRGFHAAEASGWRWTKAQATVRLERTAEPALLTLRLASGRPPGAPDPTLEVRADGVTLGRIRVAAGWRDYVFALPAATAADRGALVIELRSETFTPRAYDRTSADGRTLGVMIDGIAENPIDDRR